MTDQAKTPAQFALEMTEAHGSKATALERVLGLMSNAHGERRAFYSATVRALFSN